MAEILTESFCERCGTRYTFESAAPRTAKLKGIRVLSRGSIGRASCRERV